MSRFREGLVPTPNPHTPQVGEKEAAKKEKTLGEHKVANGEAKATLASATADKAADEESRGWKGGVCTGVCYCRSV